MVIKQHWLYGIIKFNIDVKEEDRCSLCSHREVCKHDMRNFCLNYDFGTSEKTTCDGCIHKYTRYYGKDEDRILCFKCKYFKPK